MTVVQRACNERSVMSHRRWWCPSPDRIQIGHITLVVAECVAVRSSQRNRIAGFPNQHRPHRDVAGPEASARPRGTTYHEVQHRDYPHR